MESSSSCSLEPNQPCGETGRTSSATREIPDPQNRSHQRHPSEEHLRDLTRRALHILAQISNLRFNRQKPFLLLLHHLPNWSELVRPSLQNIETPIDWAFICNLLT